MSDWNSTEQDIIKRALRIVGSIGTADTPNGDEYADARLVLNGVIKALMSESVGLWKTEERITNFKTLSQVLGSDNSSYLCVKDHVATLDTVPVSGSEYQDYWVIGGTSTTASISGESYTTTTNFILDSDVIDIEKMFVRDKGNDYQLTKIDYREYFALDSKNSLTTTYPTNYAFKRKLDQSEVHLFPLPVNVTSTMRIHYLATVYYNQTSTNGDYLNFPAEWVKALTYLLATELADEYHLPIQERIHLENKAEKYKRTATKADDRSVDNGIQGVYNYRIGGIV